MNRITASVRISDHSVYRNGQLIFENKGTDLSGFLLSLYEHLRSNYPKFYKMDMLSKLGWLAAETLLMDDFIAGVYQPHEVGLSLANANSSLDTDLKYYETVKDIPSPALFVYTLPNIMVGEICIRHHFKGESSFYISPVFEAGFMENMVNYLLNEDILKACIGGWVDLLGGEYKAVLYLVEKEGGRTVPGASNRDGENGSANPYGRDRSPSDFGLPLTIATINQLFLGENG